MAKQSQFEIEEQVRNYLKAKGIEPDIDGRVVTIAFTREDKAADRRLKPIERKTYENCQAKGEGMFECQGGRCVAHIITRQYHALSSSLDNRLYICKAHEIYFNTRPIQVWFNFVKEKYPEKCQKVKLKYEFIIKEFNQFIEIYNTK